MNKEIKWILVKSLLLVILFFGFQRGGQAQNAPVTTAASVMNAVPGQQITIPITTSTFKNIGSVSLSLDYDPNKLQFVSATINPLLAGNYNIGNTPISIDKNRLVMGWYNLNGASLPDNSIIVNYVFTYLSGSPTLQWFENGPSCDFTDPLANKLNDIPTSSYYINGLVCGALPGTVTINGPNNVCIGQTGVTYSVPLDPTINYNWSYSGTGATIIGTTNAVQVNFSPSATPGMLTVTASNACSTSTGSKDITLNSLLTPTFTTGPTNVDYRSSGNIYTTQSGKTNYIWEVIGGTITAGGTTLDNSATITWNTVGIQSVSVKYDDQTQCTPTSPTKYPVTVNPAVLTITGVTANKVYDGVIGVSLNTGSATLVGVIDQDVVTINSMGATGTFADKNVGTGKQVTTSGFTLGGPNASNYTLIQPTIIAEITPLSLMISGVTANSKTYDGNSLTTLNIGSAALFGILNLDKVTLNSSNALGNFSDKNVGSRKTVITSGFSITGADAANYSLVQPILVANISLAELTITGVTANNKVYDGTNVATLNTLSARLIGVIVPDDVTLLTSGASGTFTSKNAGSNIIVTTSGFMLGGTNAGNYILIQPTTFANIASVGLSISIEGITADNKVYDGTTVAHLNTTQAKMVGIIAPDIIILNKANVIGTFVDKNVGNNITIITSGFSITGENAGNYTLIQPIVEANILPFATPLTITGVTANNKTYDGTTTAILNTGSATLTGMIPTDMVTLNIKDAKGNFVDKNAASGKQVTITGFKLEGIDAINYTLTQPVSTADIKTATITVTGITAKNKIFDGSTIATLNTTSALLVGIVSTDNVKLMATNANGTFADKNVGTGKIVTPTGLFINGTDAGNYSFINPTLTADITPKPLKITAKNILKCFGLTYIFTGETYTTEGLVNNDSVKYVLLNSDGVNPTAIAGTYDIIPANAEGTRLSNYDITYVKGILTVIPPANQPAEFIISTSIVCKGATGVVYSVPNDPTVTYSWSYSGTGVTIHGNTHAATLDFLTTATSGLLSVIAATSCGTSIARTLPITINVLKTKPEIVFADKILSSNYPEGNQWYKDMIPITGATGQYLTPTENGNYFSVISINNCSLDTTNVINVIITNTQQYMNNTIQIFPNPAKEYFTLRSTNTISETIKLSIFSSNCILVKNYEISNKSVNRENLIDVRNLPSGLYFIRIETGNKIITQKLIIL
jgi:hypothetical protein